MINGIIAGLTGWCIGAVTMPILHGRFNDSRYDEYYDQEITVQLGFKMNAKVQDEYRLKWQPVPNN